MPAHDEALLIGACARSLMGMSRHGVAWDVVVVADNCGDDTAAVARAAGARVLERRDETRRGKPHAIAWSMEGLPLERYDAVVIVDADSTVAPDFAERLAAHAPLASKAVQAYFGLANEGDSWLTRLAGLMARMRYELQYPLKARAGCNVPLTGNGMCLGVELLDRCGWPTESLTENWELFARCAAAGVPIELAADARLYSQEAKTLGQGVVQRRRWQAGRSAVFRAHAGRIIRSRRVGAVAKLDTVAELGTPSPVLHATLAVALAALAALLPGALADVLAAAFLISLLPTLAFAAVAWWRTRDRLGTALSLLLLPGYAAWRVAVAVLALATTRAHEWKASPRHAP